MVIITITFAVITSPTNASTVIVGVGTVLFEIEVMDVLGIMSERRREKIDKTFGAHTRQTKNDDLQKIVQRTGNCI